MDRRAFRSLCAVGVPVLLVAGLVAAATVGGDDGDQETVAVTPTTVVPSTPAAIGSTTVPATPAVPSTLANAAVPSTSPKATAPTSPTVPAPATKRVQVKFVAGSDIRLRDGVLVSLSGQDTAPLRQLLVRFSGLRIERLFQRPEADLAAEKAAAEARTGRPQPDLNLYYLLIVEESRADALVVDLTRLAIVEQAYRDPAAAPPPSP